MLMIVIDIIKRVPWWVWVFVLGVGLGLYFRSNIQTFSSSLTKQSTESKSEVRNDKITRVTETIETDGKRKIETVVVDKSVVKERVSDKKVASEKITEMKFPSEWRIGLGVNSSTNLRDLRLAPEFKLQKRISGPIWVDLDLQVDDHGIRQVGAGVSVEF
jgi:hypothetical protein